MNGYTKHSESGFSLVEILVVMVIMGLVMASVFSLYLTQQRNANTSDEVIDVQQNLRIAYDILARDIRMAGFGHANPIETAEGGVLAIRTASPYNRYARIEGVYVDNSGAPGTEHLTAGGDPDDMVGGSVYFIKVPAPQAQPLRAGNLFRVMRPQRGKAYLPGSDETTSITDTTLLRATADPYLEAGEFYLPVEVDNSQADLSDYNVGDMGDILARVPASDTNYNPYSDPSYTLAFEQPAGSDQLLRNIYASDGTLVESQVLATKLAVNGLHFEYVYIKADGSVEDAPTAVGEPLSAYGGAEVDDVVAVQVNLTGVTDSTAQMSGAKSREVLGRIQLKNRKILIGSGS